MLRQILLLPDVSSGFITSTLSSTTFWWRFFCLLWLHRYFRLFVHCVSHWRYKSIPIPERPTITSADVTVIIPTIHNVFEELRPTLESVIACRPAHFMLVTTADKHAGIERLARSLNYPNVEVLSTSIANKRLQVCEALPRVRTKFTIMADDDVTWPSTVMPWLLAPFEKDARMGGVGTCQRVRRLESGTIMERIYNWLGAAYIQRRNFEISATHNIDGGTSCMSGRTGAYRSEILCSHEFLEGFKTEKWGQFTLNTDDDNYVTRYLVNHQWKTWIQYEHGCEVETTLENGTKFLYQCARWARSNWRSNWTSLVRERFVWRQQPWCTYALHMTTFSSLALLFDPLVLLALWWGTADWAPAARKHALVAQLIFMFGFTKVVKLLGLFKRNPQDILLLPAYIGFGYLHGFIRLYALFTLKVTSWGSRPDGDEHNAVRLTPRPQRSLSMTTPPGFKDLIRFREHVKAGYLDDSTIKSNRAERDSSLWYLAIRNNHDQRSKNVGLGLDIKTTGLHDFVFPNGIPPLAPARTAPVFGPSLGVLWRDATALVW